MSKCECGYNQTLYGCTNPRCDNYYKGVLKQQRIKDNNSEIRNVIKNYRIKQYEIADLLGIQEANFSKLLRYKLDDSIKSGIYEAIEKLSGSKIIIPEKCHCGHTTVAHHFNATEPDFILISYHCEKCNRIWDVEFEIMEMIPRRYLNKSS